LTQLKHQFVFWSCFIPQVRLRQVKCVENDITIMQLIGTEDDVMAQFALFMEERHQLELRNYLLETKRSYKRSRWRS